MRPLIALFFVLLMGCTEKKTYVTIRWDEPGPSATTTVYSAKDLRLDKPFPVAILNQSHLIHTSGSWLWYEADLTSSPDGLLHKFRIGVEKGIVQAFWECD